MTQPRDFDKKLPEEEVFVNLKTYFQERNLLIFIAFNRNEMQSKNELKQQSVILNDLYIYACIDSTSSNKEHLNQCITSVNYFHPALKYTWENSETSVPFLDIDVSIDCNSLSTSVLYKPTDFRNYRPHTFNFTFMAR